MQTIGVRRILFDALTVFIPRIFSVAMFTLGTILLISVFSPIDPAILPLVKAWLPLGVVEASHMVGAVVGVMMLFLARGLWERIFAAWVAGIALFIAAAILSILRELDIANAVRMLICAALMVPCRQAFNRHADLLSQKIHPLWFIVSSLGLSVIILIGFGIYEQQPYAEALWGYFAYEAGASRFLRAVVVIIVMVLAYALYRLFSAGHEDPVFPDAAEFDALKSVIPQSCNPQAWLALLCDKHILWNATQSAFVMYGISGKHWIVMGEPVGSLGDTEPLCWRLKEMAELSNARLSFYQVSPALLPLMLDLGFSPYKIGEEAVVEVPDFDLSGKKGYGFRQTIRRFEGLKAEFSVVPPGHLDEVAIALKQVSDAWLSAKGGREKRYSLGCYNPAYLSQLPLAVIRIDGQIMAFASLWPTYDLSRLSLDLMRYDPKAPPGIMEYLLLQLIHYSREIGYRQFSLGLAPLAGLEARPLSTFWYKLGTLIYAAGGGIYNFEGLRAYKEKFKPRWEPRYFAIKGRETAMVPALIALMRLGNRRGPRETQQDKADAAERSDPDILAA